MSVSDIAYREIFERFPQIQAGTSFRTGGVSPPPYDTLNLAYHVQDDPAWVTENRRRFCEHIEIAPSQLVLGEQVHGTHIHFVRSPAPSSPLPTTDGLLTDRDDLTLGVLTADCIPVFLAVPSQGVIGMLHAGWRGIWEGILQRGLEALRQVRPISAQDVFVALGPGIGPCCYEVSADLAEQFASRFGRAVVPRKWHLDLVHALLVVCQELGIPSAHLEIHAECTACHGDRYFSHRAASGRTGRMLSFIRRLG